MGGGMKWYQCARCDAGYPDQGCTCFPKATAPDRPSNKTMTALGVEFPYGFPPADPVNNPPHYNQGAVECIDAIESALGPAGFRAYCKGNALKYIWREEHKGGTESIEKAIWYLNRLVKP